MHIRSIAAPLLKWFAGNARDLPWRRTRDPYAIWVSEIMLQQTQVKTVIPYWQRWMEQLPDVESLAAADDDTVIKLWEGLGYYSRARNLQKAAKLIGDELGGRFPRDLVGVLALPGVGRYTSGAICSIAYNQPEPLVDGNVARVLTRLLGIEESPKDKPVADRLWSVADELVKHAVTLQKPRQRNASAFNQAMMELGSLVCTPRKPLCGDCPLKGRCTARKENKVETIPALGKRAAATKRRFIGFITVWRGEVFVQRRPSSEVNAGFWEFPNWEVDAAATAEQLAKANLALGQAEPLCVINHSITRYRNRLEIFVIALSRKPRLAKLNGKWLPVAQLAEIPLTAAHRKAANRFAS
ncbi:MAG: A/G-specific adenine glycosylase [Verrucomicrobia bacterium]|nr:A/G-specific adenine glycosylase [Verrucomicrobiota bacterium]